jgi:hypothetical protein
MPEKTHLREVTYMKRAYRCLSLALFLVMVAGLTLMAPSPGPAAAQPSIVSAVSDWVVARFQYRDQAALDAVASQLDVWEVHRDGQYALAAVSPDQYRWLAELGYGPSVDGAKTELLYTNAALDPRFYYYDNLNYNPNNRYLVDFLQSINAQYPDLTEVINAGPTWENLHWIHPRSIYVLRITNEDPSFGSISDKPAFFMHAEIHAREVATPELAIRYIKYLTTGYNGLGGYAIDPDATWLVDHNVAYILVMANPDGRAVNEVDINAYRRKNMDSDDGCTDPYSLGVDLNRNSSFKWGCCGGSSGSPCSETYRGPTRGGEPETLAFQTLFASVMQDQNGNNGDDEIPPAAPEDATGTFLSLHSYQDEILWPWGFGGNAPNGAQLQTIGRKLGYYSGLTPTQFLYTVDGDTYDWTYGKFGIASFLYEVGPAYGSCGDFFPSYGCIDGIDGMPRAFWNEMWDSFQYLHKIARTPYMTSYGPDAQSLAVSPASVPQGTPVQLTANIADHRYSSDPKTNVAAAEYFVDTPGADGTGIPMTASDGSFGGLTENVLATVDTSSLAVGTHYILVHGKGANNYWGPLTAIFVEVTEPEPTGTVHVHAMKITYRSAFVGYAISGLVKVLDQENLPVGGAVVSGIYTLPNGSTKPAQATTLSTGLALLKLKGLQTGTYELCVTDIAKSGYTYDPDQNRITCKDLVIP